MAAILIAVISPGIQAQPQATVHSVHEVFVPQAALTTA
jgi:hypothetical protein